jgi:O-antigen/teichoic acid export membrane protein
MPVYNDSAYRRFAQRVGLSGIASATINLRNVILLPFLTKGLDIGTYGVWVQTLPMVELGTHLASMSMPVAIIRFCGEHAGKREAAVGLWSAMALCGGIGGAIALLAWMALSSSMLLTSEHTGLFRIAAVLVPVSACERLLLVFFQARLQMLRHSTTVIFETIAHVGLAIYLVQTGFGAEEILLSMLAVRVIVLAAAVLLVGRDISLAAPSTDRLRQYLSFGLPLALVAVLTWITGQSDRYVIGLFHGNVPVGGYAVAYTLGMICTLLFAPVFMILTPTLVALWEAGDMDSLRGHLRHTLRYALAITIPAVVGLMWMLAALSETLIGIMKKTGSIAVVYGAATLLNVVLNFALIPHFKAPGAAVATFASYLLMLWAMDRRARGLGLGVPVDWVFILKCCVAASIMGFVASLFDADTTLALVVAVGVSGIVYFTIVVLLQAFTIGEYRFWRNLLLGRADSVQRSTDC